MLAGFISLKVYDLLVPNERLSPHKYIIDIFFYSLIHFILFYMPIAFIVKAEWSGLYLYIAFIAIFIIVPILYPMVYVWITRFQWIKKRIVHPIQKPWDYVFNKHERYWVIVRLKEGIMFGGLYSINSFASSFPAREQIYLEEAWHLDEKGIFQKKIDNSKGILILGEDILTIEFLECTEKIK